MHKGHDHDHDHTHEHSHGHAGESGAAPEGLSKEMETLYALISHWIDHNDSHNSGFEDWASKAESAGKSEVAGALRAAVESINNASGYLQAAKDAFKN